MGRYDKILNDADEPAQARTPSAPLPIPGRGRYHDILNDAEPPSVPSKEGKPFGALAPRDPLSWTDYLKEKAQDALMYLGAEPYKARHVGGGVVGAASAVTPLGSILSAADLPYHIGRGEGGAAALDAVGALPFFGSAAKAARGLPRVPQIRAAYTPPPWARIESGPGQPHPGREGGEVAAINAGGRGWVTPSTGELSGRGIPGDPIQGVAQQGYEAVRNAPVAYHPGAGPWLGANMEAHLRSAAGGRFNRESASGAFNTIDNHLNEWAAHGGPVTPSDLDALRGELRALQGADGVAGRRASDYIDQFMGNPPQGAVVMGTPQAQAELRANLANARGNYRAGETAETVELGIDRSGTRSGTTHSGMNVANTTQQEMQRLGSIDPITKQPKLPYATPEERTAITAASQPDWLGTQQRNYGKLLGGGGGLGQWQAITGGGGAGYATGLALGFDPTMSAAIGAATGAGIRSTGRALTFANNRRAVAAAEDAAAQIRRNSPEFRARAAAEPEVSDPRGMMRDAMAYALMPQAANAGKDWLNEQFVPYGNRGPLQITVRPRDAEEAQ